MPVWLLSALPAIIQLVGEAPSIAHLLNAAVSEVQSSDKPVEKLTSVVADIGRFMPLIAAAASANSGNSSQPTQTEPPADPPPAEQAAG